MEIVLQVSSLERSIFGVWKKKKLKQSDLKADPQAWNKDRCFWFLCEILILETWSTIITYTIRNMYDSFFIEI